MRNLTLPVNCEQIRIIMWLALKNGMDCYQVLLKLVSSASSLRPYSCSSRSSLRTFLPAKQEAKLQCIVAPLPAEWPHFGLVSISPWSCSIAKWCFYSLSRVFFVVSFSRRNYRYVCSSKCFYVASNTHRINLLACDCDHLDPLRFPSLRRPVRIAVDCCYFLCSRV